MTAPHSRRPVTPETEAKIKRLRGEGLPNKVIAARLAVTERTVQKVLARSTRPREDPG